MSSSNFAKMKICQYGEKCWRKNPIHFGEFSHPHLDQIYEQGKNSSTGAYAIPSKLASSAEVIELQLKLLEKLFPKLHTKDEKQLTCTQGNTLQSNATAGAANNSGASGYRLGDSQQAQAQSSKALPSHGDKRSLSPPVLASTSAAAANSLWDDTSSRLAKKQKLTRNIKDYIPVVLEKGKMAAKLQQAAPYNFFLTAVTDEKRTHQEPLTVTLQEIFDSSLGEIESTVQINFMVEIGWLLGHYYFAGILQTPLLVLYGDETAEIKQISTHQPQVTAIKVNMPTPFATSHAKVMLLGYKNAGMRIVISTANLYEDDWHNRTQGVWISPLLPALPDDADTTAGESVTNFKNDFMLYLAQYKVAELTPWIARCRKTDFSAINVCFIGSVPGGFREGNRGHPWGHGRMAYLLSKHATPIDDKIPIVCQSSSIGSLGANVQAWIQHDLLNSFRKDTQSHGLRQFPAFKMIYPSYGNAMKGLEHSQGCLPYSKNTNDKQPWLKEHLHQWCAKARHRSQAMPHIKSYTRFNLEQNCVYWFALTSANLSKAAWGCFNKNANIQKTLRIYNYEAGVLFLPKFVTGEQTFPLGAARNGIPAFPLPYDVPLTPYAPDDKPFLMDYLYS